jgi:hypothetical protein
MKNHTLPLAFKSFEKWVSDWSIPHESGRFNKRVSTEMSDLNDFVVALQGAVEQMIDHLNTLPTADPDLLDPENRRLFSPHPTASLWQLQRFACSRRMNESHQPCSGRILVGQNISCMLGCEMFARWRKFLVRCNRQPMPMPTRR